MSTAPSKRFQPSGRDSISDFFEVMTMFSQDEIIRSLYGNPDDDIPYFAALGKFIVGYASAEIAAHLLCKKLSGLSENKARIIFGGMRLQEIRERILGMMRLDTEYQKQYDSVEKCLNQLQIIANERHNLVHRKVVYHQDHIHVTNVYTSKSDTNIEEAQFTLTDLENMRSDCDTIYVRLEVVRRPYILGNSLPEEVELLHSAWQYKPSPPQNHKKPNRKKNT